MVEEDKPGIEGTSFKIGITKDMFPTEDQKLIEGLFFNIRMLEVMIMEFYQDHRNSDCADSILLDYKEYFGLSEDRYEGI